MSASNKSQAKRKSGKRPQKRYFTGNKYTSTKSSFTSFPVQNLNLSASGRKIHLDDEEKPESEDFKGYTIIDINLLFQNLEKYLCCKTCGGNLSMREEIVCGLSTVISAECEKCKLLFSCRNSKMLGKKKNIPEINRRCMYAFRVNGMGHSALRLFCGVMDLPAPVSAKSYNQSVKKLLSSCATVSEKSMKCAAEEEKELTGSSDIIVSGDGTWKTRGHTSRVGVCTVIGDKTGKVIDTEVLSTYCKACDSWKARKGTAEHKAWEKSHKDECLINHSGSSGMMEVVGMIRIFERSEMKHSLKYVGYIGDGDSKTFNAVKGSSPYGSDTTISKIECVGHIQKRMGTRLRKLKQSGFKCSDGKGLGGKGRLTDPMILKLTTLYGNVIREHNSSLLEMRKAVWAIYFHTRSSDEEPLHSFCPAGPDSWCKYQKCVSDGTVQSFKHPATLPIPVMDAIKPIFNDLSHPRLLQRCLGGKTQNANESLNSVIWKFCPKTRGAGKRVVEIATGEAVITFNDGNQGRIKIMEEFGLTVGNRSKECFIELDNLRLSTAELRLHQSTKEMRKKKRMLQNALHEKLVSKEGTSYAAGEF